MKPTILWTLAERIWSCPGHSWFPPPQPPWKWKSSFTQHSGPHTHCTQGACTSSPFPPHHRGSPPHHTPLPQALPAIPQGLLSICLASKARRKSVYLKTQSPVLLSTSSGIYHGSSTNSVACLFCEVCVNPSCLPTPR